MELHQLEYFVAVVETGSFSRGAERCCVAQPSLSQEFAKFERELGVTLSDRIGRRVVLTDAGRLLLTRARAVLGDVASLKRGMTDALQAGAGRLVIGAIPTMAPYLLPRAISALRKTAPDAELVVIENVTTSIIEGLTTAEIDIGLLSLPIEDDHLTTELLWSEPLLLAVPPAHPLAQGPRANWSDLEEQPAIVLHEMHCLGQQIRSFCRERHASPRILCRMSQLATIQSLVSLGLGVSIVPQMLADTDHTGELVYLPFADDHPPTRPIAVAWHPLRAHSPLATAFIECIRELGPMGGQPSTTCTSG